MGVVIDTSIIIDHLRTSKSSRLTKFTEIQQNETDMIFSLITVGELFSGKSSIVKEKEIRSLLSLGKIVIPDYNLMRSAGLLRGKAGINLEDAIISASALVLNLPVATLNTKDFAKVAGLKLYF